ncbi:MAG: hypothetical protein ACREL7_01150 [Longimicrobiales bacterium]
MKRLVAAFLTIAAGFASGCTEDNTGNDVLGAPLPSADQLDVRIVGPTLLQEDGQYRWTAELVNVDAEVTEYRWDIQWPGAVELNQSVIGPTLDLLVDADRQMTIELYLTAQAGDRIGSTSTLVTICPVAPPEAVDFCGESELFDAAH